MKRNFYLSTALWEKFRGWQSTVLRTFLQEFADFVELTKGRQGSGVIARAIDGYRSIEIANAVYRSSETGQPVTLAETI